MILIYEPEATGHHLAYLDWISAAFASRGIPLALGTTPETLEQLDRYWPSVAGRFVAVCAKHTPRIPLVEKLGLSGIHLTWWWHLRSIVRQLAANHPEPDVLVPFLPNQFTALAMLGIPRGTRSLSVIGMRDDAYTAAAPNGGQANDRRTVLKRWMCRRLLRHARLNRYFTIDPQFAAHAAQQKGEFLKVCYLPDPAPGWPAVDAATARTHFGLPNDARKVVMCFGAITLRKSIDDLIRAALIANVRVLLVGCIGVDAAGFLQAPEAVKLKNEGRLIVVDRYASTQDEQCAYGAADLVWAVYRDFPHMSSVIVAALHAGKPFVTQADGVMGYFSALLGLPTWPLDPGRQDGGGLDSLLRADAHRTDRGVFDRLRSEHSKSAVAERLVAELSSTAAGFPVSGGGPVDSNMARISSPVSRADT